jgi:hypothetical protein
MILVTHLLVDPMLIATMEFALACQNTKAIHTQDVVPNVFSILTVHVTKLAFETNALILAQVPVDKTPFVTSSTTSQCAAVLLVWLAMPLWNADHINVCLISMSS